MEKDIENALNEEAREIEEIVNSDPEVKDLHFSKEMEEKLYKRIKEYEDGKK